MRYSWKVDTFTPLSVLFIIYPKIDQISSWVVNELDEHSKKPKKW